MHASENLDEDSGTISPQFKKDIKSFKQGGAQRFTKINTY